MTSPADDVTHRSDAVDGLVELHVLAVLGPHADGHRGGALLELQLGHRVEQLGQVPVGGRGGVRGGDEFGLDFIKDWLNYCD